MLEQVEQYIKDHETDFVDRLNTLLKIPSISTASEHVGDIRKACDFVKDQLLAAGVETVVLETAKHPAVFADTGPSDGPTILLYGHYDVQPPGDLSLWNTEPFEPTLRDGAIFARGSADDKGQAMCHLMAVEAWLKVAKKLPCRVKVLIEGEEEIGSPNLEKLTQDNLERLACDIVVISDTSKFSADIPALTAGTKGLVYKDIRITGPKQNLHSGCFGGTVANPGNVLAKLIASMKDENNKITFPGFYDDVVPVTGKELEDIKALPFDDAQYLKDVGSPALDGERGYSTIERKGVRPTLDVNGMYGGYMEEGAMTIIPRMCGAKVSMRIVPNQDAEKISKMFDEFVRANCPDTVKVEIDTHGVAAPYATPLDLPAVKAAVAAIERGFGKKPVFIREGGTIPIMALFKKHLKAESVLMGFSDPNCNLHGPNEFFHVSDYLAGIRSSACFFSELAASAK
ncbi:MAG: dipeptidase [Planctomycetes bacterium]|nr:dipeptidase [Planctomycetota bacterium]